MDRQTRKARLGLLELENTRRRQNQHMLLVVQEELAAEDRRQRLLNTAETPQERLSFQEKFVQERAAAAERVRRLEEDHETILRAKVRELGIVEAATRRDRRRREVPKG